MTVVLPDGSEDSAARRVERELRKAIITLEIVMACRGSRCVKR